MSRLQEQMQRYDLRGSSDLRGRKYGATQFTTQEGRKNNLFDEVYAGPTSMTPCTGGGDRTESNESRCPSPTSTPDPPSQPGNRVRDREAELIGGGWRLAVNGLNGKAAGAPVYSAACAGSSESHKSKKPIAG